MNIFRKLPSRLDLVPEFILDVLNRLKKEVELTDDDLFHLRLILEESLTNAIRHGNKLAEELPVEVTINSSVDRLTITVRDQGQGFDFENVPDPTRAEKLLLASGRGVFLIKKIMDEVSFFDSGRGIKMVKLLTNA